eukprot:6242239-Amphidinium_carterae.1
MDASRLPVLSPVLAAHMGNAVCAPICSAGARDQFMIAVKEDGRALALAAEIYRSDKDIVLAAVRSYGSALEHAASNLRGDRDVVLEAVTQQGSALQWATESLRRDREI